MRSAHQNEIEDLKKSHESALERAVGKLNKDFANMKLELKATQDDLAKAKAVAAASQPEIDSLKAQLAESLKATDEATASAMLLAQEEIERLTKAVAGLQGELESTKSAMVSSQEMFVQNHEQMMKNHATEREEAAKLRAEALQALKAEHEGELKKLSEMRTEILSALEDEREAKEKALAQVASLSRQQPAPAPKSNGAAPADVSKEDLTRMHHAHTLKLSEVEAQNQKSIKALKEKIAEMEATAEELRNDVGRKEMELSFLETEKEEAADEIKRQQEEIAAYKALLEPRD